MKTKELIRRLQKEDPSGELEVSVDGVDIHFVSREEGYRDGAYEVLKRDESKTCYNIIGAELCCGGEKVIIRPYSIQDMFLNHPDYPVTYDSKYAELHYCDQVERWRAYARELKEDVREAVERIKANRK